MQSRSRTESFRAVLTVIDVSKEDALEHERISGETEQFQDYVEEVVELIEERKNASPKIEGETQEERRARLLAAQRALLRSDSESDSESECSDTESDCSDEESWTVEKTRLDLKMEDHDILILEVESDDESCVSSDDESEPSKETETTETETVELTDAAREDTPEPASSVSSAPTLDRLDTIEEETSEDLVSQENQPWSEDDESEMSEIVLKGNVQEEFNEFEEELMSEVDVKRAIVASQSTDSLEFELEYVQVPGQHELVEEPVKELPKAVALDFSDMFTVVEEKKSLDCFSDEESVAPVEVEADSEESVDAESEATEEPAEEPEMTEEPVQEPEVIEEPVEEPEQEPTHEQEPEVFVTSEALKALLAQARKTTQPIELLEVILEESEDSKRDSLVSDTVHATKSATLMRSESVQDVKFAKLLSRNASLIVQQRKQRKQGRLKKLTTRRTRKQTARKQKQVVTRKPRVPKFQRPRGRKRVPAVRGMSKANPGPGSYNVAYSSFGKKSFSTKGTFGNVSRNAGSRMVLNRGRLVFKC